MTRDTNPYPSSQPAGGTNGDSAVQPLGDTNCSASESQVKGPPAEDPFSSESLSAMRLSQDFAAMAQVVPVITSVAVRKPHKQEFVRVRAGADWRFETGCFVNNEDREVYLVTPPLWASMPADIVPKCLVLAITRNSTIPFIWPLTIPDSDRPNRWHQSAMASAQQAETRWTKVTSDMSAGQYVPSVAMADIADPEWPADLRMKDYLRLAFKDRLIDNHAHPILKRLRGEI